jgi:hypothetical protein
MWSSETNYELMFSEHHILCSTSIPNIFPLSLYILINKMKHPPIGWQILIKQLIILCKVLYWYNITQLRTKFCYVYKNLGEHLLMFCMLWPYSTPSQSFWPTLDPWNVYICDPWSLPEHVMCTHTYYLCHSKNHKSPYFYIQPRHVITQAHKQMCKNEKTHNMSVCLQTATGTDFANNSLRAMNHIISLPTQLHHTFHHQWHQSSIPLMQKLNTPSTYTFKEQAAKEFNYSLEQFYVLLTVHLEISCDETNLMHFTLLSH